MRPTDYDHDYGDEDYDSDDDDYAPDDYASDGDDPSDATVECSYCGAEVYEDAERCPRCGNYLLPPGTSGEFEQGGLLVRQPLWIIITALVCIYAMLHVYLWPLLIELLDR